MQHISLIFFTVLAQASAGLCLALFATRLMRPQMHETRFFTKGYLVALIIAGLAGVASLLHLGQPLGALSVLRGLGHLSPLSIEIVFFILFVGLVTAAAYSAFIRKESALTGLGFCAAVVGLLLVYAIAQVYTIATVELWHSVLTPLQFFATTLLLGFFTGLVLQAGKNKQSTIMDGGAIIAIALMLLVGPLVYAFYGAAEASAGQEHALSLSLIRFFLLATAAALWISLTVLKKRTYAADVLIFCMLLGSELLGRAYFYDLLQVRVL